MTLYKHIVGRFEKAIESNDNLILFGMLSVEKYNYILYRISDTANQLYILDIISFSELKEIEKLISDNLIKENSK